MSAPFRIGFECGRTAVAVRADRRSDTPIALGALDCALCRPETRSHR